MSTDLGKPRVQYDPEELDRYSAIRFHEKNGEGWFRVDLRHRWGTPRDVLFIKPIE